MVIGWYFSASFENKESGIKRMLYASRYFSVGSTAV